MRNHRDLLNWLRRPKSRLAENAESLAVAVGLALLIRATVAESRFIPSESMLPTLELGDHLLVEKVSYRFHPPAHGDIVVFDPPGRSGFGNRGAFIKRIVGAPRDTVEVKAGKVFLNDKPLSENFIKERPAYTMDRVTVPADSFFVMGDNRNNSADSHVWGFLPRRNIIGRAFVRYWPLPRIGAPG